MFTSDTIKKRISCRSYKSWPLKDDDHQKLNDFLLTNVRGPFGNRLRFQIIDLAAREQDEIKTLGTYGFVKGASVFIVGAVTKGEWAMEDYGYCMEKNILAATHLGLGTCWLGGTFNRSASASRISKGDDEVIPAITPVGYPSDRKSIMDSAIRFFAKSHSRKAWEELFFCGDTRNPLERGIAGAYALPLECVRIGPSASNKQPWRVVKEKNDNVLHFYLRRTPGYAERYPEVSLQDVDMGIAMCHFEAAVQEMGRKGSWQRGPVAPPQGGLEYIVSWIEVADPEMNPDPQ
ncbi:MAG: nitroreductase [Deltaproteobacteria bacterium]|nr:nitroreductase [Deltaproteobacteria bacterium]